MATKLLRKIKGSTPSTAVGVVANDFHTDFIYPTTRKGINMPCDSSYLAPRSSEIESKRCAENLVYVFVSLGIKTPKWILEASTSCYGNENRLDDMVIMLCDFCTKMTSAQRESIIYNGKSRDARQLADWWDEHQEADKEREEEESMGRNLS